MITKRQIQDTAYNLFIKGDYKPTKVYIHGCCFTGLIPKEVEGHKTYHDEKHHLWYIEVRASDCEEFKQFYSGDNAFEQLRHLRNINKDTGEQIDRLSVIKTKDSSIFINEDESVTVKNNSGTTMRMNKEAIITLRNILNRLGE